MENTRLREGWNITGDIAQSLEAEAKHVFSDKLGGEFNKIYSAEEIAGGTFAEVMICLLRNKRGYYVDDKIDNFSKKLSDIWRKPVIDIGEEKAQLLYDEFHVLIGEDE